MSLSQRVVAVVVTRNRHRLLALCLDSVESQDRPPDLTIVVDNASDEPIDAVLAHRQNTLLLRLSRNQGPAAAFGHQHPAGLDAARRHIGDEA